MVASSRLTFTVFGILGYLEPLLLVLVSVVALGERFTRADLGVYLPLVAALVLLAVDARRYRPSPRVRNGG